MNKGSLILICDDEPVVHESLRIYLQAEQYSVSSAFNGHEALQKWQAENPDLIILDLMMPEMNGTDVCKEIRRTSRVPIIMLTAKGEEIDRVLGLELGADDYIIKPFSPREVLARVKAVLRRSQTPQETSNVLRFPGLEINLDKYTVKVYDEDVGFTPQRSRDSLSAGLPSRPGYGPRADS